MKRICFFFMGIVLSLGCSMATFTPTPTLPPTAETPNLLPDPTDHTQLITVKSGETFDLVLPANSSTGYHWKIIPELDTSTVELVDENYISEQPVMPGSSGVDVWTFRGVNAGNTTIVLGYYPPSNTANPDETVTFSIRVE